MPAGAIQMRGGRAARRYQTPDWSALPAGLKDHVMGGTLSNGAPVGLHAYTNGLMPAGVTLIRRVGNTNRVHQIWWNMAGALTMAKWSTMFPIHFTEGMVAAVLTKAQEMSGHYPKHVRLDLLGLSGATMGIGKSGATMYPDIGVTGESKDAQITVSGVTYDVPNHN